jgi:co-chaperonin GroES (HSP10)
VKTIESGVRLGNETSTYIPADAAIRPLRDQIVLEPLNWRPSTVIEVVYQGKPLRGRVLAVGPGRYPLKYNGPKGKRTKSWLASMFVATEVQVDDIVELGGLELRGYLFPTILWGTKQVVLCREADIVFIYSRAEAA